MLRYLQTFLFCLIDAGFAWSHGRASTLSAAIAYFTILSLAPLLLIAVAIVGLLIGQSEAVQTIAMQVELFFGPEVAELMVSLIDTTTQPSSITVVTAVSLIVTLYAASGVFNQMQIAFNIIWGIKQEDETIRLTIVRRLVAFLLVLIIGLGMVALIIVNVIISVIEVIVQQFFDFGILNNLEDDLLVFIGMFVLLSLMYKLIPSVPTSWRDIWAGAAIAGLGFTISRYFITLYLRQSVLVPTYGAASSLVVLLIWVYFATMIILYGAAFTRAFAYRLGSLSGEPSPIVVWTEQMLGGIAWVQVTWRGFRERGKK
jgi:membrane protein